MSDQLFEPTPARTVPARHGACSWWGVDFSTTRLALAFVDLERHRDATTFVFPRAVGPERLAGIYSTVCTGVQDLIDWGWPAPAYVSLERAAGAHINPTLVMAVGAAQAGIYAGLASRGHQPVYENVSSGHWKKVALGYGAIPKPLRRRGGPVPKLEEYRVFAWARERGWSPISWDEADAAAMAEAARLEIALDAPARPE